MPSGRLTTIRPEILDPRFAPVAGGGLLQRLCTGATWSAGAVWMHEARAIALSHRPTQPIACVSQDNDKVDVCRRP